MEHFFGERPRSSPNDGETPEPIVTPSFEEAMEAIEREVEQAQPVSGVPVGKRMEGEVNINTSPLMFHRRLSPPQVKPSAQRAHPEENAPDGRFAQQVTSQVTNAFISATLCLGDPST